jgi:catechol 2,3-dioxygenase-like lactoylglutathione lyase family enzyme
LITKRNCRRRPGTAGMSRRTASSARGQIGGPDTSAHGRIFGDPAPSSCAESVPTSRMAGGRSYCAGVDTLGLESLILFVSDLQASRAFYVDGLGLPVVLHRNDRGHDERGIFPAGNGVGGAAVRFVVEDPDECERQAAEAGLSVLWPAQDAAWGRFVVLADPDGRSAVLARMNRPNGRAPS